MITRSYVATLLQSRCDAAHHGAPPLRLLPLRSRFLFVLLQGKRRGALVLRACRRFAESLLALLGLELDNPRTLRALALVHAALQLVVRLARCGAVALRTLKRHARVLVRGLA